MSDFTWVQIDSWHIVRGYDRDGSAATYCGREVGGMDDSPVTVEHPPNNEATCESCFRVFAAEEDDGHADVTD